MKENKFFHQTNQTESCIKPLKMNQDQFWQETAENESNQNENKYFKDNVSIFRPFLHQRDMFFA